MGGTYLMMGMRMIVLTKTFILETKLAGNKINNGQKENKLTCNKVADHKTGVTIKRIWTTM